MEGLSSYDKLGFDSCQIQDNTGCVQIGYWDRGGQYYRDLQRIFTFTLFLISVV